MFSHPTFDAALTTECMSSEESYDEHAHLSESSAPSVKVLRVRGLPWRSARLLHLYNILDTEDLEQEQRKPKTKRGRQSPRKERCIGPPKEGLILPPEGVASWMVSRRWLKENQDTHPDLESRVNNLVRDVEGFDWTQFALLGAESEEESEEPEPIPRSDTSYSLAHALTEPSATRTSGAM